MGRQPYYTLLASLPPLSRFDRADRLPISRERLHQRLRMLVPDDALLLERVVAFLAWQKDTSTSANRDTIARFKELAESISQSIAC